MNSPTPLPSIFGPRRVQRLPPSLENCWVTNSSSTMKHVDTNGFYLSTVLESAAAARYRGIKMTIWQYPETFNADVKISRSDAQDAAEASLKPDVPVNFAQKPLLTLQMQAYTHESSETVNLTAPQLDLGPNSLASLPRQALYEGTFYPKAGSNGAFLMGYFHCSRPYWKTPSDNSASNDTITHYSTRVLSSPDPNRREMPRLAPELLEKIFNAAANRSCEWPNCSIHAKQNMHLLAQVCYQWCDVARRLYKTRHLQAKKLLEKASLFEYSHSLQPAAGFSGREASFIFGVSVILEGPAKKAFQTVALDVTLYGSDIPADEVDLEYIGTDLQQYKLRQTQIDSSDIVVTPSPTPAKARQGGAEIPINLRLDTWDISRRVTGYQMSLDSTWSSRRMYNGTFDVTGDRFFLGYFKSTRQLQFDRHDLNPLVMTHFTARVSLPSPSRKSGNTILPASVLERIFRLANSGSEDGYGLAWLGTPASPSTSLELKNYAGVCKNWATVAAKLFRFEQLLSEINGYTHASCYLFDNTVDEPNHLFSVSVIFEGSAAKRFSGSTLNLCVPTTLHQNVEVEYMGDVFCNGLIEESEEAEKSPSAEQEQNACPLSLCLWPSSGDVDSYQVTIRNYPESRKLCQRVRYLAPGSNRVDFGYFRSTRPFAGSASNAIPSHVIRIALPEPKRKRFTPLSEGIMDRIAEAVTELSDSKKRTESWQANLRAMAEINRAFRKAALSRLELLSEEDDEVELGR